MVDKSISFSDRAAGHDFRVQREKITIFPNEISHEIIEDIMDQQKIVFVSIGPGETRVNAINDEGHAIISWTAVFGWSSLCKLNIKHAGGDLNTSSITMMKNALKGSLRVYGRPVDTQEFTKDANKHFQGALGYIIDETIGSASEYDRIIFASPLWLHEILQGCLTIRPHISPEIQDL